MNPIMTHLKRQNNEENEWEDPWEKRARIIAEYQKEVDEDWISTIKDIDDVHQIRTFMQKKYGVVVVESTRTNLKFNQFEINPYCRKKRRRLNEIEAIYKKKGTQITLSDVWSWLQTFFGDDLMKNHSVQTGSVGRVDAKFDANNALRLYVNVDRVTLQQVKEAVVLEWVRHVVRVQSLNIVPTIDYESSRKTTCNRVYDPNTHAYAISVWAVKTNRLSASRNGNDPWGSFPLRTDLVCIQNGTWV